MKFSPPASFEPPFNDRFSIAFNCYDSLIVISLLKNLCNSSSPIILRIARENIPTALITTVTVDNSDIPLSLFTRSYRCRIMLPNTSSWDFSDDSRASASTPITASKVSAAFSYTSLFFSLLTKPITSSKILLASSKIYLFQISGLLNTTFIEPILKNC